MVSAALIVSVGDNEISEGLLDRADLPPPHFMTGAKHDCSGGNDTGAGGCVTGERCFPTLIFHTFRNSYITVSSRTTKTDSTIPVEREVVNVQH